MLTPKAASTTATSPGPGVAFLSNIKTCGQRCVRKDKGWEEELHLERRNKVLCAKDRVGRLRDQGKEGWTFYMVLEHSPLHPSLANTGHLDMSTGNVSR
jgi:hypothetical protein